MKRNRLRIAIQKKGRLNDPSMTYLSSLGLKFYPKSENSLIQKSSNFDLDLLLVRDDDIPWLIERGVADFGIVGRNVFAEASSQATVLQKLTFGACRLAIAAPESSSIRSSADLQGKRIATTYPYLLGAYLKEQQLQAEVIFINGSVEIAPELGIADAICDIVQSGTTLKVHNLVPIATVMESQAELIASPFVRPQSEAFIKQVALV